MMYTYHEIMFKLKNDCNSEIKMMDFENNIKSIFLKHQLMFYLDYTHSSSNNEG